MEFKSTTRFYSDFDFIEESANDQTPDETLMIMSYEQGMVVRHHMYAKRYGKGHFEEQFAELSDMIAMTRMFCQQYNRSFEEILQLGEERYQERMQDLKGYGIKDRLKKEYRDA